MVLGTSGLQGKCNPWHMAVSYEEGMSKAVACRLPPTPVEISRVQAARFMHASPSGSAFKALLYQCTVNVSIH
jgi:hypothetical protein